MKHIKKTLLVIGKIFLWILLIRPTIICATKIMRHDKKEEPISIRFHEYYVFITLIIFGIVSIIFFMDEIELIDHQHLPTIVITSLIVVGCYFLSRKNKFTAGPLMLAIIPTALLLGIILFIALFIHSCLFLLIAYAVPIMFFPLIVLSVFALPIVASLQAVVLLSFELFNILKFNHDSFPEKNPKATGVISKFILKLYFGKYGIIAVIITLPFFISVVQLFLLLYSQPPDSLILAFTESKDGLFSSGNCEQCKPSSGGNEYLCTIAAHGNPKLVKPLHWGMRTSGPTIINRQLKVCNAFEALLIEKCPKIQRVLRHIYDGLQIPIHKWKHVRWLANLLYLLVKPLELFCLVVLYLFEKNPEEKIRIQYLATTEHNTAPGGCFHPPAIE